jgi:hypothetical protein
MPRNRETRRVPGGVTPARTRYTAHSQKITNVEQRMSVAYAREALRQELICKNQHAIRNERVTSVQRHRTRRYVNRAPTAMRAAPVITQRLRNCGGTRARAYVQVRVLFSFVCRRQPSPQRMSRFAQPCCRYPGISRMSVLVRRSHTSWCG